MVEKQGKGSDRWYDAALSDKEQIQGLSQQVANGINSTETSGLPDKLCGP